MLFQFADNYTINLKASPIKVVLKIDFLRPKSHKIFLWIHQLWTTEKVLWKLSFESTDVWANLCVIKTNFALLHKLKIEPKIF